MSLSTRQRIVLAIVLAVVAVSLFTWAAIQIIDGLNDAGETIDAF